MEVKVIKLEDIRVAIHNHRKHIDESKLKELSESIKEKGVIEPIIVRPTGSHFEIVCGERRYRASQLAGNPDIPAVVRTLDDKQTLEFQVIENLQREDVHPLEEAEGYELLMKKYGYKTVDDLAAKVGKSKAYIYGRLKLLDLLPDNRKRFYDDIFSPSVALVIARVPKDIQLKAAKDLIEDSRYNGNMISLSDAVDFIQRNFMLRLKDAPFDVKASCAKCPKRTINEKELFADISKEDRCTDPACFEKTKNAHIQSLYAKAKSCAGDKQLLSPEESKTALSYRSNKYAKLTDNCYDYPGQSVTYDSLMKKAKGEVSTVYAVDQDKGKIVQLVDKTQLREALKAAGLKSCRSEQGSSSAKGRREERIRRSVLDKMVISIIAAVRRDNKQTFLRGLAEAVLHHANFDGKRVFIQRHDPTVKGDAVYKEIDNHLKAISDSELLIFCLEILLANEGINMYGGPKYGKTAPKLCKHYKIDIAKIEAQVKLEVDSKKKK